MKNHWTKLQERYFWLLISSALAGVLGDFPGMVFDPASVVRAMVLAVILSMGTIAINHISRKRFAENQPTALPAVVGLGAAAGVVGGAVVNLCYMLTFYGPTSAELDFRIPLENPWAVFILCISYGVTLHAAYAMRRFFPRFRRGLTFLLILIAGFLCGMLRGCFHIEKFDQPDALILALFTGFPFALFWGLTTLLLHPAWTLERWRKLEQPATPSY